MRMGLGRIHEGFGELVIGILVCFRVESLEILVRDGRYSFSSRFLKDNISLFHSCHFRLSHSRVDTYERKLRPKHLLNMRLVTFSILSLAALGAAQSSVVSLFLEVATSYGLVGSIAGSVSNNHLLLRPELTGEMLGLHRNNLRSQL